MMRVAVCVTTFGRLEMLRDCLLSIIRSISSNSLYDVTLIVIDNNEQPVAKSVVESVGDRSERSLVYAHEVRPGIPFARNRALEVALEQKVNFIAFIDDDETVEESWFSEMMKAVDRAHVDVVSGPVLFNTNRLTPRHRRHSSVRKWAETGNVIFKVWIAERLRFDESLALYGGSDTLFFRQAFELGAIIRWCESAVAIEKRPKSRQTLRWRIQRQWRYGIVSTMIESRLRTGKPTAYVIFLSLLRIVFGALQGLLGILAGPRFSAAGFARLIRGTGSLAGLFGFRYEEYRRE